MELATVINKVEIYCPCGADILYQTKDGVLKNTKHDWIEEDVKSFRLFKRFIFIQKQEEMIVKSIEGQVMRTFQGKFFLVHSRITEDFFFVPCRLLASRFFMYYDIELNQKRVDWDNNFVRYFFNDFCLSTPGSELGCHAIVSGRSLWQLNFCDLLQNDRAILHSEIIEHKGKLYFVLDGAENRGTFCVDIESGEVLNEYDALQGWLVKDGDYIYTIRFSETVVRLDTRTNEIVEWDIQELNGIGLIAEVAQNGFIYFVQNIGVTDPKVGVLDFDNRELVWSYSFTGNHGLIGSIKVHDNRLFVHTQDNTLHIFEKE